MSTRPARPARPAPPTHADQLDLFGPPPGAGVVPEPRRSPDIKPAPGPVETNDVDLIRHVAGNAGRKVYVLVGTCERVYARSEDGPNAHAVVRVPGYEEAAVHQLITRGWLTLGGQHRVTCGAAQLTGTAVLAPKATRDRVAR